MKSSMSHRRTEAVAFSAAVCVVSQTDSAVGVTDARRRSTYLAVTHWAEGVSYAAIWHPLTTDGKVLDFPVT